MLFGKLIALRKMKQLFHQPLHQPVGAGAVVPLSKGLSSSRRPGGARSQGLSIPELFSMVSPSRTVKAGGSGQRPFPLVAPL